MFYLRTLIAAILITVITTVGAAAEPLPGAAGLMVRLGSAGTLTDANGAFRLSGVKYGHYQLLIANPSGTLYLVFPLAITLPIAEVMGVVGADTSSPGKLEYYVKATTVDATKELTIDQVGLKPRRWNLNYAHSSGKIKVFVTGQGLADLISVSLATSHDSIESSDWRFNEEGTKAMAFFAKDEAFRALVPDGAAAGDVLPVTITLNSVGGGIEIVRDIILKGNPGKGKP